jgi:hypothetical protein
VGAAISIALFGAFVVIRAPWYWRLLLAVPATLAATGLLQSRSKTCVLRAKEGTFENDDGSTSAVSDEDARASRDVARVIQRDSVLIGLASAALAVALSFI